MTLTICICYSPHPFHPLPWSPTEDKAPCTELVYAKYMVVPCPEYQHFSEPEHAKFFQSTLDNIFEIFQLSKL